MRRMVPQFRAPGKAEPPPRAFAEIRTVRCGSPGKIAVDQIAVRCPMSVLTVKIQERVKSFELKLDLDPAYPNESTVLSFLQSGRYYEPDVSNAMMRILREGDTAIDVGANIGFFTVLLGKLVGPAGRVLSVEPDNANLERLKANLALNGIDNADLLEQPVTDQPGEVTFFINSDNSGGNALWDPGEFAGNPKSRANPQPRRLAATTLDAEAARLKLATPRLIKIDTEGAEQRVLEGARGLLEGCRVPFVIAELHEFGLQKMGCSGASLRALMEGFGYSTFALYYDGALPKFVPRETALAMRVISSVLFSTPEQVGSCWPATLFDPAQVHDPAFS